MLQALFAAASAFVSSFVIYALVMGARIQWKLWARSRRWTQADFALLSLLTLVGAGISGLSFGLLDYFTTMEQGTAVALAWGLIAVVMTGQWLVVNRKFGPLEA